MNHYKWVVLTIQDLSTSELVHSAVSCEEDTYAGPETFDLSEKPIQYFVNSDNIEELLRAKEVMLAACNSIYEVTVEDSKTYTDQYGDEIYMTKVVPAYLDNFVAYNRNIRTIKHTATIEKLKKQKKAALNPMIIRELKKIHKNRFQIVENFVGGMPEEIEIFRED